MYRSKGKRRNDETQRTCKASGPTSRGRCSNGRVWMILQSRWPSNIAKMLDASASVGQSSHSTRLREEVDFLARVEAAERRDGVGPAYAQSVARRTAADSADTMVKPVGSGETKVAAVQGSSSSNSYGGGNRVSPLRVTPSREHRIFDETGGHRPEVLTRKAAKLETKGLAKGTPRPGVKGTPRPGIGAPVRGPGSMRG